MGQLEEHNTIHYYENFEVLVIFLQKGFILNYLVIFMFDKIRFQVPVIHVLKHDQRNIFLENNAV